MTQTKVEAPFVENNANFRNKVINGDMQVSQRGTSFSLATSAIFTTDRFQLNVGEQVQVD